MDSTMSMSNTPRRSRQMGRSSLKRDTSSTKRLRSGGDDGGKRRKKSFRAQDPQEEEVKPRVFMSPTAGGSPILKGRVSRTVPNREACDMEVSRVLLKEGVCTGGKEYGTALARTIFSQDIKGKVLTLGKTQQGTAQPPLRVTKTQANTRRAKQIQSRIIPQVAERVLDAPCIVDDYSHCLIDWSPWANMLAVALNDTLYSWDAVTGVSNELCSLEDEANAISSVSWIQEGSVLAIGSSVDGTVRLFDASQGKHLTKLSGHTDRVCTMAWNQHILTTGGKDGTIIHHDVRVKNHIVSRLKTVHSRSEVRTVTYSPDFSYLASSDDSGTVGIWDASPSISKPIRSFTPHSGAVKALSWSPTRRHYLATGGYQDSMLKVHKATTCDTLTSINTGSEITCLRWSNAASELATTHGHPSDSLRVWSLGKGDKLKELADIKGHNERILHMTLSPDGQTAVTCSADETIRFWKIFSEPVKSKSFVQLAIR